MKTNRMINLWVSEYDLENGYFVLQDVLTRLPKDTALVNMWNSHSSAHSAFRLSSKEFPEVALGTMLPRADFKYTVNDGASITWPSKEYEAIALKVLNEQIEASISKTNNIETFNELLRDAYKPVISKDIKKLVEELKIQSGCIHEWFSYGRTSAIKNCKKCGIVKENI